MQFTIPEHEYTVDFCEKRISEQRQYIKSLMDNYSRLPKQRWHEIYDSAYVLLNWYKDKLYELFDANPSCIHCMNLVEECSCFLSKQNH